MSSYTVVAARSELEQIRGVMGRLSRDAFAGWANQSDIVFVVSLGSKRWTRTFRIAGTAILVRDSSVRTSEIVLPRGDGTPCVMVPPDVGTPAIGHVAFSHGQESRPISLTAIQSDVRVQLKIPENLEELSKLWKLLNSEVRVWRKDSIQHGFVVQVESEGSTINRVEYEYVHLDVREDDHDGQSSPLCLVETKEAHSHFANMQEEELTKYDLNGFEYAYVQVLEFRNEGSYDLFVAPVKVSGHERRTGGLQVLRDACLEQGSAELCSRWMQPYSQAFPELSTKEGIPRSASFDEILDVLRVFGELEPEGEIELVGLSMPIRRTTLIVIAAGVVMLQSYLLLAIMMTVQVIPVLSDREKIPWIALFVGSSIPNYVWYASLIFPVLSVLALVISMSTPRISDKAVDRTRK